MNLVSILLVLLVALIVLVKFSERFGKSISVGKQASLARLVTVMIAVLLCLRLLQEIL